MRRRRRRRREKRRKECEEGVLDELGEHQHLDVSDARREDVVDVVQLVADPRDHLLQVAQHPRVELVPGRGGGLGGEAGGDGDRGGRGGGGGERRGGGGRLG